jgi:transposase
MEGYRTAEVAAFLGVGQRTVRGWVRRWRRGGGPRALRAKAVSGRPPKLTRSQERQVLSWLRRCPTTFGFPTSLWTARRVAWLIEKRFGARFNHRYLSRWLARRNITPQKPARVPRERDQDAIDHWIEHDWPRIKKRRPDAALTSF